MADNYEQDFLGWNYLPVFYPPHVLCVLRGLSGVVTGLMTKFLLAFSLLFLFYPSVSLLVVFCTLAKLSCVGSYLLAEQLLHLQVPPRRMRDVGHWMKGAK